MKFKDNHEDVSMLNLHEGHRGRLRERLLRNNFSDADDYLILEYILTLVVKRRDTNDLAHTLVSTFGSLAGVFDASTEDLEQVKGVTPTMAYFLHSIPYIFRNYNKIKKMTTCEKILILSIGIPLIAVILTFSFIHRNDFGLGYNPLEYISVISNCYGIFEIYTCVGFYIIQ